MRQIFGLCLYLTPWLLNAGAWSCTFPASSDRWPSRPVELVVFSAAGGGTDLASRALAAAMEKELGVLVRVSNMTGGRGGAAAQYVYSAPDGYRWLGASDALLSLAVRGAHPTTSRNWHYFIFTGSPGVLSVSARSPYRSFDHLLAMVREKPDRITVAASGPGSIWHLRTEVLRRFAGFKVRYIPYPGSSPSQVAALSGEVDAVLTAAAEQIDYLRSGHLRPLAMIESAPSEIEGVGTVPAITDWLPELRDHFPLPQWLGFMVPRETPAEVLQKITNAYGKAVTSEAVETFLRNTGNALYGLSGTEAQEMAERLEKVYCWLLYDLDLAQQSPERHGISRP